MIVLGVDPGTLHTGIGLVTKEGSRFRLLHYDIFNISPKLSISKKLLEIHRFISEIIQRYRPDLLALENIFFGRDVRAMVKIGEARACAMLAASQNGISVIEYPPASVKQAVSGNGRASKEQIQFMIKKLLGLKEVPPTDGADALAVAICHLHQQGDIRGQISKARKQITRSKTNKKLNQLIKDLSIS